MIKQFVILDFQELFRLNESIQKHILTGWIPIGSFVAVPIKFENGEVIAYNYYQSMAIYQK
jgi:hypothetical protein